jgi:hypothetical protein
VIELFPFNLREDPDFRVEMDWGSRGTGTNQDGRFQPFNPFATETTQRVNDLFKQVLEKISETRIVILGPLQQNAAAHFVKIIECLQRPAPSIGDGIEFRSRRGGTSSNKVIAWNISKLRCEKAKRIGFEKIESAEVVRKSERLTVEQFPKTLPVKIQVGA